MKSESTCTINLLRFYKTSLDSLGGDPAAGRHVQVVAATIVVAERVEGSSLGHLVVKLAMYVWLLGDVASVQ